MTTEDNEIKASKKKLIRYYQENNYDEAIIVAEQLLILSKEKYGEISEEYATNLSIVASLYRKIGKYSDAENKTKKALRISGGLPGGEKSFDYALNLNNLAALYQETGDYTKSEEQYKKVLTICETPEGRKHLQIPLNEIHVVSLNNLALLYQEKGNYANAEEYYKRALEVSDAIGGKDNQSEYAKILSNLGEMYRKMGRLVSAELLFEKANKYYRKGNDPDFALNLNNLAMLYQQKGELNLAEKYYQQALLICGTALGRNHRKYATILDNLAALYREKSDYETAETKIKEALEIRAKTVGSKHPDYAAGLSNLAILYREKGNFSESEKLFSNVLKIRQQLGEDRNPDYAYALSNLAIVCAATGRNAESFRFLTRALISEHKSVERIFTMSFESVRIAFSRITPTLYVLLSLMFNNFSHSGLEANEVFELVLKHRAIWDFISAAKMKKVPNDGSLAIEKLNRLQRLRNQILANVLILSTQKEKIADKLYDLVLDKERLEAELTSGISTMQLEKELQKVNLNSVYEALGARGTLIEFIKYNPFNFKAQKAKNEDRWEQPRYLAFILTGDDPSSKVQVVDIGEAAVIDVKVSQFRRTISFNTEIGDDVDNRKPQDESLLKTILEPLLPFLKPDTRLIIAPDGELTKIPFEIIPTGHGQAQIIDRHLVSYINTGSDLLRQRKAGTPSDKESGGESIVAGNLDFNAVDEGSSSLLQESEQNQQAPLPGSNSKLMHFDPMPGTEVEAKLVAELLGVKPLIGKSGLKSKFRFSRSPKILHLATHAFFLSRYGFENTNDLLKIRETTHNVKQLSWLRIINPLVCCGLALVGANNIINEGPKFERISYGLITGEDISEMNLAETDLVVLSCSDVGLDPVLTEGLFGLGRAFKLAEARSLVMSLWKTPGEQKLELLLDFYRRILDGQPKADALRSAKLKFKSKNPDSIYWGNLICFGNS